MNTSHKFFNVKEGKIQASILLKDLRADDHEKAKKAAKRFQLLLEFRTFSLDEIIQKDLKRKTALAVIAAEQGFKSWAELKCQAPFILGGFLNHWFANYAEAKEHLKLHGGFLLPYKNQYFICDASYIEAIGLNPADADWSLIGYDWANPDNKDAWRRLYKKWMAIQVTREKI